MIEAVFCKYHLRSDMRKTTLFLFLLAFFLQPISAFDGHVDITNETGYIIYYVFISPVDAESWGDDLLNKDVILPGDTQRFNLVDEPGSIFDIQVEDVDGDAYTITDVDLTADSEITFSKDDLNPAETDYIGSALVNGPGGEIEGTLDIFNQTGRDIYYLYGRQQGRDWGSDLLGDDILVDGGKFTIEIENFNSEIFDIKLEDEKKKIYEFTGIDIASDLLTVTAEDRN